MDFRSVLSLPQMNLLYMFPMKFCYNPYLTIKDIIFQNHLFKEINISHKETIPKKLKKGK